MGKFIYQELEQGTDEWLQARCGLLTASEMKLLVTPTLKVASNDKVRAHMWEIAAQRVTKHVEQKYVSEDMLRGHEDELRAKALYAKDYDKIIDVGFITNDKWGFKLGYSPDGLLTRSPISIECKSRRQKFQIETIVEWKCPDEHMIQVQTGMLVGELIGVDYVSYCGGMPMAVILTEPDTKIQKAILEAAESFEEQVARIIQRYSDRILEHDLTPTERTTEQEIVW